MLYVWGWLVLWLYGDLYVGCRKYDLVDFREEVLLMFWDFKSKLCVVLVDFIIWIDLELCRGRNYGLF